MALLDVFKKKTELPPFNPPAAPPPMSMTGEVPLNQVLTLQNQGLSNNQIIQTLQRQGFAPPQIYDALAQAEAKKSIEPLDVPGERAPPPEQGRGHPDSEVLVE